MNKIGINPVTIRPAATHPGPSLVLSRLHISIGGPLSKLFTAVLVDEKTKNPLAGANLAVLDEDQVIGALGHLFPVGELANAHLDTGETGERKTTFPGHAEAFKPVVDPQGRPLAAETGDFTLIPTKTAVRITAAGSDCLWEDPETAKALNAIPGLSTVKVTQRNSVTYDPPVHELEFSAGNPSELARLLPGALTRAAAILRQG